MTRPDVTVRIDGARELRAALKRAGVDLRDLRAAHKSAAEIAAAAARANTPVLTGALAGTVRAGATQTRGVIRAGSARVPYANPIHWGWARRGIAPNPFASEGAQQSESRWADVYRREVDRLLEKVGRAS